MNFAKKFIKQFVKKQENWSIGIYVGTSVVDFVAPKNINNPVLTAKDVKDVPAEFVADPFMINENGIWYMFFEVMNTDDQKGDIALATSTDAFNWTYQQIVIDEYFHLSYPYVFKWNDEYYLIPESNEVNSIRLYKAVDFPTKWTFVKDLISGDKYSDASVFYFQDYWWLLTSVKSSDVLYLYYANDLLETWIEHPKSPVIKGNKNIARPGGRVIVSDGKIIRYTQDDEHLYGNQVRAFEITDLTTKNYEEKQITKNSIIKGSGSGWNKIGMHNIDPHKIDENKWIACVDGYQISWNFRSRKRNFL